MSKLPLKITPCPILEVTVEIKFITSYPHNAIFGIIYNAFKDKFDRFESLPITQIPEEVRINDPNFKFKVFYKIYGELYTIQVGYDVITLHCNAPYVGWETFSIMVNDFIKRLKETAIIKNVVSLSLQYLNFFENDIFKNSNVSIEVMGKKIDIGKSTMKIEIPYKDYIQVLQIANNIIVDDVKLRTKKAGSILDITLIQTMPQNFFEKPMDLINSLHKEEKEIFYGLIDEQFLSTLNPMYAK